MIADMDSTGFSISSPKADNNLHSLEREREKEGGRLGDRDRQRKLEQASALQLYCPQGQRL